MNISTIIRKNLFLISLAVIFLLAIFFRVPAFAEQSVQDEINKRNQQIAEIQKQIDQYEEMIRLNQGTAQTLSSEIARLNATINKVQLEIQNLNYNIENTDSAIVLTETSIIDAQQKISLHKTALAGNLQAMYELDNVNLTQVLLSHDKLSDFFNNLNNVVETQSTLSATIRAIEDLKIELENKQDELENKK